MSSSAVKPKPYLLPRQEAVRRAMEQRHIDGLLLTHPPDLAYLTDFTGDDSVGLITGGDLFLVTDFRYKEQAEIEAGWLKTSIRQGKMSEALAATLAEAKAARVGFEANTTTVGQLEGLKKAVKEAKDPVRVELVTVEDVLVNIRKIKDDTEIELIRQSIAIAEKAYQALKPTIRVGQTENQVAGRLVYEMRLLGASNGSFPAIIAAGASSSLPHYRPGPAPVQSGQALLIDWGALYMNYCSDLTRTLMVGPVPDKLKEIYAIVLDAQQTAIAALAPGITTVQADQAARQVIEKAGYGEQFGHGLGHGIGRDIHELPTLRKPGAGQDEELQPGMVVTIEPGIYLPGIGGVRIEDDVLITRHGCQVLSSLDKSFAGCHIE